MLHYSSVPIIINGSGFVATSVDLNQNIDLNYPKTNNNFFCNQSVAARELNQISISNTRTTSGLHNHVVNFVDRQVYPSETLINYAGLSGIFYLSSFSLSLNPTEAVNYNYVLNNYLLSGSARTATFNERVILMSVDENNEEDYSWKSVIKNSNQENNYSVIDLSYKLNYNIKPKYFMGNTNISRVDYLGASEVLTFTITGLSRIQLDETTNDLNVYSLDIYNLYNAKTSSLNLSGFRVKEKNISHNGQTYLSCNIQAERVL